MNNSNSNSNIPGLLRPTQIGMIGNNPQDSALKHVINGNAKLQRMQSFAGGKKYGRKRGGIGNGIAVHQYNMSTLYPVQNGPGQDPNSTIRTLSTTGPQSSSNRVYDNLASVLTGGSTNMKWGCYSGGRIKKKRTITKKSVKSKKRKTFHKRKR